MTKLEVFKTNEDGIFESINYHLINSPANKVKEDVHNAISNEMALSIMESTPNSFAIYPWNALKDLFIRITEIKE